MDIFRPAAFPEPITDPDEIQSRYKYWRVRIFYSIYFGYVFFYFTRKSFTFAMPMMINDLGFSKADLGILGSILYITYGISKFISGFLSDQANPRYFMATGLILTGISNLFFGLSSSILYLALFWGLNGIFQGWGWPPCTKQLTFWFSQKERGLWWSIKSTSHNVGGALIPLLVAFTGPLLGWRWSMYIPGIISIIMGLWLLERLRDVPGSLGLPSIETYKGEAEADKPLQQRDPPEARELLWSQVLSNGAVWVLALSYFFVYVVRTGFNDWGIVWLNEYKGYSYGEAAGSIAWFEVGGFLGCIAAGWGSDRFFQGRRVPFMVLCALGLLFAIVGFWFLPAGFLIAENLLMFIIGFLVFGPQILVGLAAAEFVDKHAACTANGFAGCFAYIGAASTGYPLGKVIDIWGWHGFFLALLICSAAIFLILFPLWAFPGRGGGKKIAEPEKVLAVSPQGSIS
ncbi:MAG: MFS transporter [Deltaproteobacteria bacterium]|nr:MFS transporter [Deltaproteobacteria bacterium]